MKSPLSWAEGPMMPAGAADHWTKPIDFDRFVAGLHRLLGAAQR